jgi:carboxypeptidase PM20D1
VTEVFPDAVPAPYVMMAATDSRFFTAICDRVYRFAPFRMTRAQRAAIHAADERLGTEAYLDGVGWYRRLIERLP